MADVQIGQTAIEAYLTAFQRNTFDPFPVIASSFVRIRSTARWKLISSLSPHHTLLLTSYFRLPSSLFSRSSDSGYASYLSFILLLTFSFPPLFTCSGRVSRNYLGSGIQGLNSMSLLLVVADGSPTFSHFSQVPYQRMPA